jgi:2-succinyl-5-enolpyruvyl-6-hydroxy-3-cyclohexene-1-carboxylate synthase
VGASVASKTPTLLISGDLSFLYDSNGLWNTHFRNDFKIVVINNGGGGIFRILPGTQSDATFATFFETQHALTRQTIRSSTSWLEYLPSLLHVFHQKRIV